MELERVRRFQSNGKVHLPSDSENVRLRERDCAREMIWIAARRDQSQARTLAASLRRHDDDDATSHVSTQLPMVLVQLLFRERLDEATKL
mmetsp:Transcript_12622/g.27322  ORF Transcript_12622/g.27322 Transcript_12622/m.27322 type:complete len:90 (+) Transcript_12622:4084-4353(+)